MKILIPIDVSKQSEKALDYAVNLQQQLINEDKGSAFIIRKYWC
jgi:hypothetical protein